jgi:hypothetical protein
MILKRKVGAFTNESSSFEHNLLTLLWCAIAIIIAADYLTIRVSETTRSPNRGNYGNGAYETQKQECGEGLVHAQLNSFIKSSQKHQGCQE